MVLASVFWATGVGGFGVAPCGVKQSVVVQHSSTVLGAIRCYDSKCSGAYSLSRWFLQQKVVFVA